VAVEESMMEFEKALKTAQNQLIRKTKKINLRNLTLPQLQTLQLLKTNTSFIIKPTDKNLGPAILDAETYKDKVLSEHLLTKDYRRLSEIEANSTMENIKSRLKTIISTNLLTLSKAEITYFQRSLQRYHRLPLLRAP